jgi:hypothetical protein
MEQFLKKLNYSGGRVLDNRPNLLKSMGVKGFNTYVEFISDEIPRRARKCCPKDRMLSANHSLSTSISIIWQSVIPMITQHKVCMAGNVLSLRRTLRRPLYHLAKRKGYVVRLQLCVTLLDDARTL